MTDLGRELLPVDIKPRRGELECLAQDGGIVRDFEGDEGRNGPVRVLGQEVEAGQTRRLRVRLFLNGQFDSESNNLIRVGRRHHCILQHSS